MGDVDQGRLQPQLQVQKRYESFLGLPFALPFQIGQTIVPVYSIQADNPPLNVETAFHMVQDVIAPVDGTDIAVLANMAPGLYRVWTWGTVRTVSSGVESTVMFRVRNAAGGTVFQIPQNYSVGIGMTLDINVRVERGGSLALVKVGNAVALTAWSATLVALQQTTS